MPTRNVVLTQHHHHLIESALASGRYQKVSEVLRERLRPMEQREALEATKRDALKAAVQNGWNDLADGRYRDAPEDGLTDLIRKLGRQAAASGRYERGAEARS